MRKLLIKLSPLFLALSIFLTACGNVTPPADTSATASPVVSEALSQGPQKSFSFADIPQFANSPYVEVNDNIPYFSSQELTTEAFETYSELDSEGRCGVAFANICKELMPTGERGEIGMIKPSGWHISKYDFVDGKYLYNRCHLIGFQLAGENANSDNLITGTRYLNVEGMLPFENEVADYVKNTENHVLYRVTPIFEDNNLVASGVLMEAKSVEDNGKGVQFNVFCYNAQPGVSIDYLTGENTLAGASEAISTAVPTVEPTATTSAETHTYILNTNTKKFHLPDCKGVSSMSEKNKKEIKETREQAIADGYSPCGICKP